MPVDNPTGMIDVRLLVRWLGPQGAKAGLEKSKRCTVDVLAKLAEGLGLSLSKSTTRKQMIEQMVRLASRRIDKPLAELLRLGRDDLVAYLEKVDPERDELLELLKEIDAHPTKEGRRALIDFAARELSETARFMRIASGGTSKGGAKPDAQR